MDLCIGWCVVTDDKDTPIISQDYIAGVKVVDIGDLRVSRGMTRRPYSSCKHTRLQYDPNERRVWCPECEKNIEPFDAFELLVQNFDRQNKALAHRRHKIEELEGFNIISLAAKAIDKAWRKRKLVPMCPSCKEGLFPEDFKDGVSLTGRDYALARRAKKK